MKSSINLFTVGLILTMGCAGAVDFLPPDASLDTILNLVGLTIAGILAMATGANDIRLESKFDK